MRNAPSIRCIGKHPMNARARALEYSGELFRKFLPFDTVQVVHGAMRGKTRPERRGGIVLRPIDELRQRMPIRLVGEHRRARLGAGPAKPRRGARPPMSG